MTTQDRDKVRQVEALVVSQNGPAVAAMLESDFQEPPRITWNPTGDDLQDSHLNALFDYWRGQKGDAAMPRSTDFDLLNLGAEISYIMLLDVRDGGWDFVYRYYGVGIAERSGFDMTGRSVRDIPAPSGISIFFLAGYRAVMKRREPLLTWHAAPTQRSVVSWERLILPLATETDGHLEQLVVCNMPGPWRRGRQQPG